MVNVDPFMDVENSPQEYIENLFCQDPQACLEAVRVIKNSVIGSNKQKGIILQLGVLPRLFQFLLDKNTSDELMIEAAVTLGSLARGTDKHVEELLSSGLVSVVMRGLTSPNPRLMEACLRCLRTVLSRNDSPIEVLYEDSSLVPHLVSLAETNTQEVEECVMTIFYSCCKTTKHQDILCDNRVLDLLTPLLVCRSYRVQIPCLKCLAAMCYQNERVSELAAIATYAGEPIPDILISLMSRDRSREMQLSAAKCMTYMFRAGALLAEDPRIVYKALPTLVRMCQEDVSTAERVAGAETLAYLTEVDTELQRIASISDHLIETLSKLLRCWVPINFDEDVLSEKAMKDVKMAQEMKQAAFKAFASLAANDEDIRRKILEAESLMEHIVSAFSDPSPKVRLSAVRCLHSLSRSVQQLRTTFQDHAVWRPLMELLRDADDDLLTIASSSLCNLLLEFSPSKEPILEGGAIDLLCNLTRRTDPSLRLNGVWALMNVAFQSDTDTKNKILATLGSEHVFNLLADPDPNVLMKTLGLLRNLLSTKPVRRCALGRNHIDHIMSLHGKEVMQAVILILEGLHEDDVKEQAICILTNIADGNIAKEHIMNNEDVLKKLTYYMLHSNVKLQIAATYCISNLVWKDEEGAAERQEKLKNLGVQQVLTKLLTTSDTVLFDRLADSMDKSLSLSLATLNKRVKIALQQFPSSNSPS